MEFQNLAKIRASVRSYRSDPVSPEALKVILEAGRVAPTAANTQSQRILVVQDTEGLAKVAKAARTFQAPLVLVVYAEESKAWTRPHDGWNSAEVDSAIVMSHMMLQAADLGLGSVWVAHFRPQILAEEFPTPAGWVPLGLLVVGHPAAEVPSPSRHDQARKPLSETVFTQVPPTR